MLLNYKTLQVLLVFYFFVSFITEKWASCGLFLLILLLLFGQNRKAGIQWFIVIVDQNGKENLFSCQDIFYFNMAACIRWYSTELPALSSIKKVKIVAGHPVFWNEKGEGVEGR